MRLKYGLFSGVIISLSLHAFAADSNEGNKMLQALTSEAQPKYQNRSQLPKNFGGSGKELTTSDQALSRTTALNIANADELQFQNVIQDVFSALEKQILVKKLEISQISSAQMNSNFFEISKNKEILPEGIVLQKITDIRSELDQKGLQKNLSEYLKTFKQIHWAVIEPVGMSTPITDRTDAEFKPTSFFVNAHLDIRGIANDGQLKEDAFNVNFAVRLEGRDGKWALKKVTFTDGLSKTIRKPMFTELKSFSDQKVSTYLRKEAIRRGGYALAVNDINKDGYVDLIVGHVDSLEVFLGQKDGTFKKADLGNLGIEKETLVKSVTVADYDNDGIEDILMVRFAPNEQVRNDIALYKGQGDGKFKKLTSIKNRFPSYYAMPTATADFNNDGYLDFYVGFPGAKDFTVLNKKRGSEEESDHQPQGLFYNQGGFNFVEVTKDKFDYMKAKHGELEKGFIFPHSAMALDYNLDGLMDIVVIDDKGNLSPLYKNDHNQGFVQIADSIGINNSDFGMGFTAADLNKKGHLDFIYSNVNFFAANRIRSSISNNFSENVNVSGADGLHVFSSVDGKNYSDVTNMSGMKFCGQGIAGVEVIDYNNDGYPDVYVANGLWSGTNKENDLSSLFIRASMKFNYDYQEVLGIVDGIEQANSSFMKVLKSAEVNHQKPSMAGFQRNCLFRNNGDGTFTEVGYLAGVDSISDGYIVGTADFNKDGKMDLILRNGDPGITENLFSSVQIFQNNVVSKNKSLELKLEGSISNYDAIGAIVEAKIQGQKMVRHLVANNGAMQSEKILHFGMAQASKIDELNIRWPSGQVEKLFNVKPGFLKVKEKKEDLKTAGIN